jgi:outer membrane protein TolC
MEIQENIDKKFLLLIKQIEILVEQDVIPAADLNYIRANYLQSRTNYLKAKNLFIYYKKNLVNKIGIIEGDVNELNEPPNEFYISNIELKQKVGEILEKAFNQSLINRNDFRVFQLLLSIEEDRVGFYKKELLPKIDVKFSIGYNGIFESSGLEQFYKPYYENIPGINYGIGLIYSFDIKNDYNKGKLLSAKGSFENQQTLNTLLREEIILNLSKYLNDITNYSEITKINKSSIKYYEEALENETIKLKLGTSTVINFVQIQTDYYKALEQLNNTLLDLNASLLYFRFYSGTLCMVNENKIISIDYQNLFLLPYNDIYGE